MKLLLILIAVCCSAAVQAQTIYKCKDKKGNVSYGDQPCFVQIKKDQQAVKSQVRLATKTHVATVKIDSQQAFDDYIKSLSFDTLSELMVGITPDNFHGINIDQLFSINKLDFNNISALGNNLGFQVNVSLSFKLFLAEYSVLLEKGKTGDPFFDMSNEALIDKMNVQGIGQPKVISPDGRLEWRWKTDKVICRARLNNSYREPEHSFDYSCEQRRQIVKQ